MKRRNIVLMLLLIVIVFSAFANKTDGIPNLEDCKTCVYAGTGSSSASASSIVLRMCAIISVIILAMAYGWISFRKKIYLFLGSTAVLLVSGSYIYSLEKYKHPDYPSPLCATECLIADSVKSIGVLNSIDSLNPFSKDQFSPVSSDFENANISGKSIKVDTTGLASEFSSDLDDFSTQNIPKTEASEYNKKANKQLYQTIVLLLLTALIGLTIKYQFVRNLRGLVLLSSLIYLGFIRGACPCMIMSLQHTVLFLLGGPVAFAATLWFLGLIIVTYFLGKTWCGWLCHLGALQDFLFRATSRKWLASEKSQFVIKYVQILLLVILIVQLIVTRTIIWIKYDPFKVAFNLISANAVGYVLLVLLLISSILIYRPFCRTACPVGLILGWITKLPGARKLSLSSTCNNCRSCTRSCKQNAIHSNSSGILINTEDCILCGDCINSCKKNSLSSKK